MCQKERIGVAMAITKEKLEKAIAEGRVSCSLTMRGGTSSYVQPQVLRAIVLKGAEYAGKNEFAVDPIKNLTEASACVAEQISR